MTVDLLPTRRAHAVALLGAALLLGVLWHVAGTMLPDQLSLVARFAVLLTVIAALARLDVLAIPAPDRFLLGVPAILLLAAIVWRDSEVLVVLDVAALVLLVALAVPGSGRPLVLEGAGAWIARVLRAGVGWVLGAIPAGWGAVRELPPGRWRALAARTLGVLAISPALFVFAALFSGADPLFGEVVRATVSLDLWRLTPGALAIGAGTWQAAGLLWVMARPHPAPAVHAATLRAPIASVTSALVAVELLFATFVALQARHLFGGRAYLLAAEGLTVAEYARKGFFELVVVAALTLPVLMTAEWLVDPRRRAERLVLRRHALVILGLLALILCSALSRMLLYTGMFGLTQSRLYTVVFMGWLAFVLGWFAMTSLRGLRHRFMAGALASGVQALLLLNLANPEGIIVRVNVARAAAGEAFDASYVSGLGFGALPALLEHAHELPPPVACEVLNAQRARLDRAPRGKASWNVERHRAAGALRDDLTGAIARACGVRS